MKITIMSRAEAERYDPFGRAAIISVTDPVPAESCLASFSPHRYVMVHREQFDDVCYDGDLLFAPISWEQAERIAGFIRRVQEQAIDELVIHCEAGISRSSGIAAAVCSIVGVDDAFCYQGERRPNPLVRERVLQSFMERAAR